VEVLRAALGHDADLAAGRPAIFGIIVRGQDLDFLGRIRVGDADAGAIGARAHGHRAVLRDQRVLIAPAMMLMLLFRPKLKAPAPGRFRRPHLASASPAAADFARSTANRGFAFRHIAAKGGTIACTGWASAVTWTISLAAPSVKVASIVAVTLDTTILRLCSKRLKPLASTVSV